jgi:hypothetical protein
MVGQRSRASAEEWGFPGARARCDPMEPTPPGVILVGRISWRSIQAITGHVSLAAYFKQA